jgi:hypothetical protein
MRNVARSVAYLPETFGDSVSSQFITEYFCKMSMTSCSGTACRVPRELVTVVALRIAL